jgi:hypothetical protein
VEYVIVKVWNGRLKIILIEFYVQHGKNEFHWMLNSDECLMRAMNKNQIQGYGKWLTRQQEIIHQRTL